MLNQELEHSREMYHEDVVIAFFKTLNHNLRMVLGLPGISEEKTVDDDYITKRRLVIFCFTLIYSIQTAAVAVRFVGLLVISMD